MISQKSSVIKTIAEAVLRLFSILLGLFVALCVYWFNVNPKQGHAPKGDTAGLITEIVMSFLLVWCAWALIRWGRYKPVFSFKSKEKVPTANPLGTSDQSSPK